MQARVHVESQISDIVLLPHILLDHWQNVDAYSVRDRMARHNPEALATQVGQGRM